MNERCPDCGHIVNSHCPVHGEPNAYCDNCMKCDKCKEAPKKKKKVVKKVAVKIVKRKR